MMDEERIEKDLLLLKAAVAVAPGEYRIITNSGTWASRDTARMEECYQMRDEIIAMAVRMKSCRAELGIVMMELAASVWHSGMTRETFLENACLWYESAKTSHLTAMSNASGGTS